MNIFAWPGILVEVCHRGKTSSDQGLMDTLVELPSRTLNVRLQEPPRRHSQHSRLLVVVQVARQNPCTAHRQLLVSSRSWQWTIPEAFVLMLYYITILESRSYINYPRSNNESLFLRHRLSKSSDSCRCLAPRSTLLDVTEIYSSPLQLRQSASRDPAIL